MLRVLQMSGQTGFIGVALYVHRDPVSERVGGAVSHSDSDALRMLTLTLTSLSSGVVFIFTEVSRCILGPTHKVARAEPRPARRALLSCSGRTLLG